ncbi:glycosyltransferase family 2 protein [Paenibacillus sp. FJAT-27812]|uniref:glycosyltransferase family 2 protein n=1 Tax=Paenibacillus sp. FJAT-27812 TaxID=1684143 RepID=UPI0006A77C6F|nr:glycosyltransferase [Paenibacillus sp. FJAT-27812]
MFEYYRQGCTDGGRRRDLVKRLMEDKQAMPVLRQGTDFSQAGKRSTAKQRLSVIIPAQNEEAAIGRVIQEVKQLSPAEIIVVVNGSFDRTEKIAHGLGASIIGFQEPLGTDVGRAIGALASSGEQLLFVDGDFVIPWKELVPFADAVLHECDLAVNKLDHHLRMRIPWSAVTTLKIALNMALGRVELANASLVPVPFAMNRRVLEAIPWSSLLCPPKAYALAVLSGLSIKAVHKVEVDRLNRYRPHKHNKQGDDHSPAAMQIIGDHFEALHAIHSRKGNEGDKWCRESLEK